MSKSPTPGVLGSVLSLAIALSGGGLDAAPATVVINEIHYHPADDLRDGEFVELHNHGAVDVFLGGWMLTGGVNFRLPADAAIPAGGYLVVAANAAALAGRYGAASELVIGDFGGSLENDGERVELRNAEGIVVSWARYEDGEPWPETPDGLGPSLERRSAWREDDDAAAWGASIAVGGTPGARNSVADAEPAPPGEPVTLIPSGAEWRFLRGRAAPPPEWKDLSFDDAAWEIGPAGFGYDDGDDATTLGDMLNGYLTVFIRRRFDVEEPSKLTGLTLTVDYDDGFIAYLNGSEIARRNVAGDAFDQEAAPNHEAGTPESFAVANLAALLRAGPNVLAIQGHNAALDSSDFSLSPSLEGTLAPLDGPPPQPEPWEPAPRNLVLNEIFAGGDGPGWVELFNPGASEIDAGGRRIEVFPRQLGSYVLPAGAAVPPRGFLTITESELGLRLETLHALILATGDGRFIDGLNPRTAAVSHSTGRFPDGDGGRAVFTTPTLGAANALALESRVVINEIRFHPAGADAAGEYIELHNRGDAPVDVGAWGFTRGITFEFPPGTSIPAGGFLVLARDPAAIEAAYGIAGVLGPWTGALDNDAETLLLRDAIGNAIDRVRYADEGSWPEGADGAGPSLELVHPALENRYGPAWRASDGAGTPGAVNSRFESDPAPIAVDVRHVPVLPTSRDAVRVLVHASDETAVAAVTLFFEIDGSAEAPQQLPMADDGALDDGVPANGIYGAEIPAQPDRAIVAFWIQVEAAGGQTRVVPAGAPRPAFLYQVVDDPPAEARPSYRVVLRAADLRSLRTRGNNSNVLLDCTFIAGDRAWYNRGVRYRGQSARSCNPLSYRIQFDHDADFHGIKRLNLNGCNTQRQWIGLDVLGRSGIETPSAWFRRLRLNEDPESSWHLRVEAVDDQFLDRHLGGDADGNLYRGEGQANLDYRGEDSDDYRGDYAKITNEAGSDWSDVADLSFRFDADTTPDEDFPTRIDERVDVLEWTRFFAVYAALGSNENSILLNNGDDYFLYHRFSDDRWMLLPWDLDSCFDDPNQVLFRPTVAAIARFLRHPYYAPLYWCQLQETLGGAFEVELLEARLGRLAALFGDAPVQPLRLFAERRRAYVGARLRGELTLDAVSGGGICRGLLFSSGARVTLSGAAPGCETVAVLVNGQPASFDAASSAWSRSVDLSESPRIEVAAINRNRDLLAQLAFDVEPPSTGGVAKRPDVHEQPEGADSIALRASDYQEITDPDGDGNTWLAEAGVDGALGADQSLLRAPDAGEARGLGQSLAVYRLRFRTPGSYRSYYRARGFDQDSDSIWRPSAFDRDPDVLLRINRSGALAWFNDGDFTVTPDDVERGRVFELRIGVREFRAELDAVVLSARTNQAGAELTALFGGPSGRAPHVRAQVLPGAILDLAGAASVRATLDGSASHDGQCGTAGLTFLWEKVSGPDGASFIGDPGGAVVEVELAAPGAYGYRLTVANLGAGGTAASASLTITVNGGVGGNAFTLCDANGDGSHSISDAVHTLAALFSAGPPSPCAASTDCNADTVVNLSDPIFSLNHLFLGGPAPPAPYPDCDAAAPEDCAEATCRQ